MRKQFNIEGWPYVVLYFALMLCLALTVGCSKPMVLGPHTVQMADSLAEKAQEQAAVNGWQLLRTGVDQYTFIPPKPAPKKVKYKNVGNDYSKDKSKLKDNNNTKAKGEAIIGNHNAPIDANRQAVVGDGNSVEQQSNSLWWLWLLLGVVLTVGAGWYLKYG